jgi:RecT family
MNAPLMINDPIPLLDTGRFEHMIRIAKVMGSCSLIPDCLCKEKVNGTDQFLPPDNILANCFLVVNQAVRWEMDPFAVAQCVSVVKGKLCYEGKLIAAVIEHKTGIRLLFDWNDEKGDKFGIIVSGKFSDEDDPRQVSGTVGDWKTTRDGSPWVKQPKLQLAYRGSREWARLHAPALMLGVYSPDEMDVLNDASRASRARDVSREPPPPFETKPEPAQIESKPAVTMELVKDAPEPAKNLGSPVPTTTKQAEPPKAGAKSPWMDALLYTAAHADFIDLAKTCIDVDDLLKVWERAFEGFYTQETSTEYRNEMDRAFRLAEDNLPTGDDDDDSPPAP